LIRCSEARVVVACRLLFFPLSRKQKICCVVVVVSVGIKTSFITETMRKRNKYNNNRGEKKSSQR
jgi:hypothetical protein